MGSGAMEYSSRLVVWPMATAGRMDYLPKCSARMPRGTFATTAVKERRLMIIPSWRVVAPFCVI